MVLKRRECAKDFRGCEIRFYSGGRGGGGQILPSIFWSGGGNDAGPSCSKVG